jgi:hypothetical protein
MEDEDARMRYQGISTNSVILIISMILAAGVAVVPMQCAHADRIGPKVLTYPEIVEQSDLVIIGRTLDGNLVQVKDEEGPPPQPVTEQRGMVPSRIEPMSSSWRPKELLNPPKIWAYRASVEALEVFRGEIDRNNAVSANLGYGISKVAVEFYLDFEASRKYCSSDSVAVFHLVRVAGGEGDEDKGEVYELLLRPWPVDEDKLGQAVEDMKIRFERYDAMQRIEGYLDDLNALDEGQLNDFLELISSSKPGLGTPVYLMGQKEELDRLIERTREGTVPADEWRKYWKQMKHYYVVMPFIIIGDDQGDPPDTSEQ